MTRKIWTPAQITDLFKFLEEIKYYGSIEFNLQEGKVTWAGAKTTFKADENYVEALNLQMELRDKE